MIEFKSATKASISIASLLSVISTDKWAPLDMSLMPKLTGYKKAMASVKFREMLGLPAGSSGGERPPFGLVEIDHVGGAIVARCYECRGKSGHRFHWRVFPRGTANADILDSAKRELGPRAFLSPRAETIRAASTLFAERKTEAAGAEPSLPAAPPAKSSPHTKSLSDNDLIAKIKALRTDLEALEAERDRRVQHAADLIAKLKG